MSTSSVSRTRATNLTGLIDIDALVEANTLRQKTKINTATQKLKIEEYKQEQYRTIIDKSKTFYNKYCDILSGDNLFSSSNYNTLKATSSDANSVTATASSSAKAGSYKVSVTQVATSAQYQLKKSELTDGKVIKIDTGAGAKEFKLIGADEKARVENLNKEILEFNSKTENANKQIKVSASFSDFVDGGNGGLVLETTETGEGAKLYIDGATTPIAGKDAEYSIEDMTTGLKLENQKSSSNSITLDGVTFNLADKVTDAVVTVKKDGTELKDKIVDFINDYNELLGAINTKLYEKYDSSYKPLTDEDKEGLSDSQIEKLEAKAQVGLLRNDEYLRNFAEDMKLTMSSMMSSSGLSLERLGIKPVKDYTSQNGLFKIADEDKLLEAIEADPEGVQELFTKGMSNSKVSDSDGILTKLKNDLYNHATWSASKLAEKAGIPDTVSATQNEMSKDIKKRKELITEMQAALIEKENNLYTKYSTLESNLAALQSQQSSLTSYFSS